MDSVCLQVRPADRRRDFLPAGAARGIARLLAVWAILFAGVPVRQASAAIVQLVQSGTAVSSANGIVTVTLPTAVDTTKSVLIFQGRSNSNRPVAS